LEAIMRRVFQFIGLVLCIVMARASTAVGLEWGFSSPEGAVVNVTRDINLNVTGTVALPSNGTAEQITIPLSGRNEPGKLILEFEDPKTGVGQTITYERGRSSDGSYTIWRAQEAPNALGELRSPINVSSEPAKSALESWSGNSQALIPVEIFSDLLQAHREASSKLAIAAESSSPVAVVTDRPSVAAWDGAASRIGRTLTSVQTFRDSYDRVLFTMDDADLVAALDAESTLLRDFGGVVRMAAYQPTAIPLFANPNLHVFTAPIANLFHTYAVENYNLSKVRAELDNLVNRLERRNLTCVYGEAATATFTIGCLHHCSAHSLRGNYLVSTLFTFSVGEERSSARQLFVMADSWAANAKDGDPTPGRDRFTYLRASELSIDTAHEIALSSLSAELADMYKGFRRN
jgi:hypothetical protein